MLKFLKKLLFSLCILYLTIGIALYCLQDFLVFPLLKDTVFSNLVNDSEPPKGISEFFVETSSDAKLNVWTTFEAEHKTKYAAIIFHGNGETVTKGNFLPFFKAQDIAAFTFDYRGYGKSTGWPSEQKLYQDAEAIYDKVKEITALDTDHLIILGNSIGTGPAAYLASKIKPKALLLIAPYYSFSSLISQKIQYAAFLPFLRYQIPSIDFLKQLDATCVVLAHGKQDKIIPFSQSEMIYSEIGQHAQDSFLVSDEAGHNDIFYKVEDRLAAELQRCIN